MREALIHRARQVGHRKLETRNAQGAYDTAPFTGPWIKARVMERGAVAPKRRREPEQTTGARVERGYEMLLDSIDDDSGAPVAKPPASAVFETECEILGNPTIELSGEPETLTNGVALIGYMAYGDVPKDRA